MAANQDLLRKVDALLSKHRGGGEIPVLTDVVENTVAENAMVDNVIEEPALSPIPASEPKRPNSSSAVTEQMVATYTDAQVEALSRDIFLRVMARLGDKISGDLRDHLTERLSSIIDNTVSTSLADFKQELADTVADAIAEVLLDRADKTATASAPAQSDTSGSL